MPKRHSVEWLRIYKINLWRERIRMFDYLKEVFGDGAISYEQFTEKVKGNEAIKLANLKEGGYVGKDKFDTLLLEKEGLKKQLEEANTKLSGFDPEWEEKAKTMQKQAEEKIAKLEFDYILKAALKAQKAKNPEILEKAINREALKLVDGKIIGLEEQLKQLKESDGYLFEGEAPTLELVKPTHGESKSTSEQMQMDSFYRNNPFYKKR